MTSFEISFCFPCIFFVFIRLIGGCAVEAQCEPSKSFPHYGRKKPKNKAPNTTKGRLCILFPPLCLHKNQVRGESRQNKK